MEHNCLLSPLLTAMDIHCRKSHDTTIHNDKYYYTGPKFVFKDTQNKIKLHRNDGQFAGFVCVQ